MTWWGYCIGGGLETFVAATDVEITALTVDSSETKNNWKLPVLEHSGQPLMSFLLKQKAYKRRVLPFWNYLFVNYVLSLILAILVKAKIMEGVFVFLVCFVFWVELESIS